MKFVLMGHLSPEWVGRTEERSRRIKAKLGELGITQVFACYTMGEVDFVGLVEAPNEAAVLAYSAWYLEQGFGRFRSLRAFDHDELVMALGQR